MLVDIQYLKTTRIDILQTLSEIVQDTDPNYRFPRNGMITEFLMIKTQESTKKVLKQ